MISVLQYRIVLIDSNMYKRRLQICRVRAVVQATNNMKKGYYIFHLSHPLDLSILAVGGVDICFDGQPYKGLYPSLSCSSSMTMGDATRNP
jgi:hypothetical protein